MTVVLGASAHGSPGVSTALQLLTSLWPTAEAVPVLVEADLCGGVAAARFGLSLTPGFVTLAESLRKAEKPPLLDHAQRLPSGVACVAISPSATAASAQVRSAGTFLGAYLGGSGHPTFVDAGSVQPDGRMTPVLTAADLMLWFVRPTREELLVLRHRMSECAQAKRSAIVLVGDTPYNAEQVHEALGVEVIHTLPDDRRAGAAVNLGGDDRYLRRSSLARACGHLVSVLVSELAAPASVDVGHAVGAEAERLERAQPAAGADAGATDGVAPALPSPPRPPAIAQQPGAAGHKAVVVSSGPLPSLVLDEAELSEQAATSEHRVAPDEPVPLGSEAVLEHQDLHDVTNTASDDGPTVDCLESRARSADDDEASGSEAAQSLGQDGPSAVENLIEPGDSVSTGSEPGDPTSAQADEPLVVWTPDS